MNCTVSIRGGIDAVVTGIDSSRQRSCIKIKAHTSNGKLMDASRMSGMLNKTKHTWRNKHK